MRAVRLLRFLRFGVPVALVVFGLMQLVPYRISNPRLRQEPGWDSPQTRRLAVAACFDCHSNETKKPWYAQVAPVSWWVTNHVDDGRKALNFSEWRTQPGLDNVVEAVQNGSMPPGYYAWLGLHPQAKLTKTQRDRLVEGLRRTLGASPGAAGTPEG